MSQLSILHTVGSLKRSSGGPSRSVSSLCQALGTAGVTVNLVAQDWQSSEDDNVTIRSPNVTSYLVGAFNSPRLRITFAPAFTKKIKNVCRSENISIMHDHGLWLPCNYFTASVSRKLSIPLVVQPRGMLEPWALSYRSWKKQLAWQLFQRKNLQKADLLIATSEQEAKGFRAIGLTRPIAIIPNGVDMPPWKEQQIIPDRKRYALFLSRIHPIKGLLNLVQAWQRLRPLNWRLVIAGPDEGHHLAEVKSAVNHYGLEQQIEFLGPVEGTKKANLYRSADLFVLPTFSENFGIVVAEALSYGVPVITTKGAPWGELLIRRCGWWIDIGVEPLVEAIREATSLSDEERQQIGLRGRKWVEKQFSWPKIADEMIAVYQWVLGHNKRPKSIQE